MLPYSWRKNARISLSRISINEWLNIIETKMFVDKWMILWTKIKPFRWPHKNIIISRVIGDWLQKKQDPILFQWNADLMSNKHQLFCNKQKKELEKINNGHRFFRLLHGGVGKVLGGPLNPHESLHGDEPSIEKTKWPSLQVLGTNLQDMIFLTSFFSCRWIVDNWRPSTVSDGSCKYNISNDVTCFRGANVCTKHQWSHVHHCP